MVSGSNFRSVSDKIDANKRRIMSNTTEEGEEDEYT
jgi:hypothetical protein